MGRNYTVKFYGKQKDVKKNWLSNVENAALYNETRWRKLSKHLKMLHPVCCVEGCTQPTSFIDHDKPYEYGDDFYDQTNLQWLCVTCNARKTGKQKKKTKFKL